MTKDNQTKRFIRSQGDLDGACLLYSLVNAVSAINGEQIAAVKWSNLLKEIYDGRDFLDTRIGSGRMDLVLYTNTALFKYYLEALAPNAKFNVEILSNERGINRILEKNKECKKEYEVKSNLKNIKNLIDADSVLIVANKEHWFCIVDFDDSYAKIACSSTFNEFLEYSEQKSYKLKRIFNNKQAIHSILDNMECLLKITQIVH